VLADVVWAEGNALCGLLDSNMKVVRLTSHIDCVLLNPDHGASATGERKEAGMRRAGWVAAIVAVVIALIAGSLQASSNVAAAASAATPDAPVADLLAATP
jgi:hypothetical protein